MLEAMKRLKYFRQNIYDFFSKRADASFELVDALSSNTQAKTVVELSLNPWHRRNYCSITRAIGEFYTDPSEHGRHEKNAAVTILLTKQCPALTKRSFHLFGIDCTSNERLFSPTLDDRSPVYTPRPAIAGNKPITIGHQYSVMVYFPEKLSSDAPPWVIPLSAQRVHTQQSSTMLGMQQISTSVQSDDFKERLCVSVADSAYSTPACLLEANLHTNLVHISRLRGNRTLPRPINNDEDKQAGKKKRGRPKKYGDPFILKDEQTLKDTLQTLEMESVSKKGHLHIIKIEMWDQITLYDQNKIEPFTVIRIKIFKENGELLFKRALWLLVSGQKRHELSLQDIFESYRQRFDIEHFFRFGKNRLLLDQFQTPEVTHEEAWWQFNMMAYTQIFMSREIAHSSPQPWEKYLPVFKNTGEIVTDQIVSQTEASTIVVAPTQAQKDFSRIIREIGTPAQPLKPHHKSLGRQLGKKQTRRQRHAIVYKSKKKQFHNTA